MGLKKRSKVSAEFNMSSLTDIIFLLLIFFMLTSNFVKIQPFKLPQSDSKTVAATSVVVTIDKNSAFTVNNHEVSAQAMDRILGEEVRKLDSKDDASVTIVAEMGTPFDEVVKVMNAAARLKVKAIIATEPRS